MKVYRFSGRRVGKPGKKISIIPDIYLFIDPPYPSQYLSHVRIALY